jgi:Mce-associated membrane protein
MATITENEQLAEDENEAGANIVEPDEADSDASSDQKGSGAESEADSEDAPSGRRRRWTRHARTAVIALIVAAALAGVGALGWTVWHQRQITRAGQDAQQAAVAYAQVLTSIDSGKVDQNFTDVLNGATGEFKDMYSQASVELRQLLVDNKATAHGVVVESAVQSATADKVVVLLFVDQSITNTNVPDPRVDRSRIKMTMDKVDGRWRASKVELP